MAARIRAEGKSKTADADMDAGAGMKRKADEDPKKEEEDSKKLEAFLPILEKRFAEVEDEADKVTVVAAPLAMEASEELRELQASAIKETEKAVKAAMASVMNAKKEVDKRAKEAEGFASFAARSAKEEIAKLQPRLDAAVAKIDVFKNVRKDHEQAIAAEVLFAELSQRLVCVEIDSEKAAMMAEPLAKVLSADLDEVNAVEIRETKEALRVAQATLAPTSRLISGKVQGLTGRIRARMVDLQSRAENAQNVLDKAQQTVEEAQSRAATAPILKQAADRIEKVEEALLAMRETEAPLTMGIETMPADESGEVLAKMEKAAVKAKGIVSDSLKFVALKLVEIGRLAEVAATAARRELDKARQQLDEGMARVLHFQAEAAKRRRQNLVVVVREKLEDAETAVSKVKEASTELQNLEDQRDIEEALERALIVEEEALAAVDAARKEAKEKQQEFKPQDPGSQELVRTKTRVNYMDSEMLKFRKLAASIQEKFKVAKALKTLREQIGEAEAEVERFIEVIATQPKDQKASPEADEGINAVQQKLTAATTEVEDRLQLAQGLELKELRGVFSRLQRAQSQLHNLKDQKRQHAKAASLQLVTEATDAVRKAEASIATVSSTAAAGDLPAGKLEELNKQVNEANAHVVEASRLLSKQQGTQLDTEGKVEFARLQLRCKAVERRGRATADRVGGQFEALAAEVERAALDSLRKAARNEDDSYDTDVLFVQISGGAQEVSELQFVNFLGKSEPSLPADKAKLALSRLAPQGLSRRNFASALADYQKIIREITLTDEFEINSAKKLRKLEVGEIVEATSAPRSNNSLGLERIRCRAVRDGAVGWVTVKSSGGTTYLSRANKPFLWCCTQTAVRETQDADSKVKHRCGPGEVVELVKGPVKERVGSDKRVRGVACHEEAVGWLQVSDKDGKKLATMRNNIFKCSESIVMTDIADFENCTTVRRIQVGEALQLVKSEDEIQPEDGGSRRKFRACGDGREGWITMQGSQGTVYLKPVQKHYVCLEATPMHSGLGAESAVVRVLMPGEAFSAFEEPRDVAGMDDTTSYLVRPLKDGVEGWVTATTANEVQEWSTRYKILKTVPLTGTLAASEAADTQEVARLLEPGEYVDVAEPPCEDVTTNFLRVRCVATKDKVAGWVTVREGGTGLSSLFLRPATAEEVAKTEVRASAPSTPPQAPAGKGVKRPAGVAPWHMREDDLGQASAKGKGKVKGGGKGKFKRT